MNRRNPPVNPGRHFAGIGSPSRIMTPCDDRDPKNMRVAWSRLRGLRANNRQHDLPAIATLGPKGGSRELHRPMYDVPIVAQIFVPLCFISRRHLGETEPNDPRQIAAPHRMTETSEAR